MWNAYGELSKRAYPSFVNAKEGQRYCAMVCIGAYPEEKARLKAAALSTMSKDAVRARHDMVDKNRHKALAFLQRAGRHASKRCAASLWLQHLGRRRAAARWLRHLGQGAKRTHETRMHALAALAAIVKVATPRADAYLFLLRKGERLRQRYDTVVEMQCLGAIAATLRVLQEADEARRWLLRRAARAKRHLMAQERAKRHVKFQAKLRFQELLDENHQAARLLQGCYRSKRSRAALRMFMQALYERVYDEDSGSYYFHNVRTGAVSWVAPKSIGSAEDVLTPRSRKAAKAAMESKKAHEAQLKLIRQGNRKAAASLLQAIYRRRRAKKRLLALLRGAYEKVWDPLKEQYYYHNTRTGEVKWERPAIIDEESILSADERNLKLAQKKARKAQRKAEARAKKEQEQWNQYPASQQWDSTPQWSSQQQW